MADTENTDTPKTTTDTGTDAPIVSAAAAPRLRYRARGGSARDHRLTPNVQRHGHQVTVPLPARATSAQTNRINAHGVLVGMAGTDAGKQFAFVYRNGKATRLPTPSGFSRST